MKPVHPFFIRFGAATVAVALAGAPLWSQPLPADGGRPVRESPPAGIVGPTDQAPYAFASYSGAATSPAGNVRTSAGAPFETSDPLGDALAPQQSHAGPEVFSIDVQSNPAIRFYYDYYSTPDGIAWLGQVLQRAAPFRDFIASRIAYYGLPPELIYLPVVESTYDPRAVSYTGAAGLWQFMSNSIDPYDMRINEWIDERFDFWKSTDASLQKLKYNYQVLGDWLLALAAYNAGLGALIYITDKSGIRDLWQLAAKGYLSYETQQYIPKFLAITAICTYGGRHGLPLNWDPPFQWDRLKLDQAVDLRILARQADVPLEPLLQGNAELRYDITPPGNSDYNLKVPVGEKAAIAQTLQDQRFKLMKFYLYTITAGDTLYDLGRYYGVPVSMILQYNPQVQPRFLQFGTQLIIPGIKDLPAYHHAAPQAAAVDVSSFFGTYTVQSGDTLWSISLRYSTSIEAIAQANALPIDGLLHGGMKLKVPLLLAPPGDAAP